MKRLRSQSADPGLPGIVGVARPVRSDASRLNPAEATRRVASRVEPGDIAIIDQLDLDRVSAQALVAAKPAAVVNVRSSISGRHPARGASVLLEAGIPLVDDVGPSLLSVVRDGQQVRLDEAALYDKKTMLGRGQLRVRAEVTVAEERARTNMAGRLVAVGADAAGFLRAHEALLLEGDGLPEPGLKMAGRAVLVVPPGERSAADVARIRPWVAERRPIVITADAGAELAAKARLTVDLMVGDIGTSKARRAIRLNPEDVPAGLSATDLAVLLAVRAEAALIVLAGSAASYDELLDRDRDTAAALLAVRLRAGDRLVDAAAVAALHRPAVSLAAALVVAASGVLAVCVAFASTAGGRHLFDRLLEVLSW